MRKTLTGILLCLSLSASAQPPEIPKEINLVFNFLLKKEYPESFKQKFQIRPVHWQIIDIDDDGITEVFLQTFPHYRQSPTITIFQIDKRDSVTRLIEGFAPGRLVKLSDDDDYLDTHTTGTAIDMRLNENSSEKFKKFGEASIKFGMSVVLYKNFIHTDKREGKGVYIDLMYLNDYQSEGTCENFQFSKPEAIIAGKIAGEPKKYFIAKAGNELFCYRINGFLDLKFVDKEVKLIPVPGDFKEFEVDNGVIKYLNTKGKLIELTVPQ